MVVVVKGLRNRRAVEEGLAAFDSVGMSLT